MKIEDLPADIQSDISPRHDGDMFYRCLGCETKYPVQRLLYTCPKCGHVLLIYDNNFDLLKQTPGQKWQKIFDYRKALNIPGLKGIYLFHEFIGPKIPLESIVYLGEGHTPVIEACASLQELAGCRFFFKNEGQNPSASFKDRGMASAFSYINYLLQKKYIDKVLAVCASTGDTSASAALYASFLEPYVTSAVLLPHKKVTPQQLAQPLGSGAKVFEIPGVFDDCMKVVEKLSDNYNVALLNSKNPWRILGQESYSYEIAQAFEYKMGDKAVIVPIGNAGNITAIMSGFLKFYNTSIIDELPIIIGVQSHHADPVYRYYEEPDPNIRKFVPVSVQPSTAQAAMIGNPVSMPRVIKIADTYDKTAGKRKVFVVRVTEQSIMDCFIKANRKGHIACTHGGESFAGLIRAVKTGIISKDKTAILASTAHALKFLGFQNMYFENKFPASFGVKPDPKLINKPVLVKPKTIRKFPSQEKPLTGEDLDIFVNGVSEDIAKTLSLSKNIG